MAQKVRIVVDSEGSVGFFTEQGTLETGKVQIKMLVDLFAQNGIKFSEVGEVEQHRHDDPRQVHLEVHSHDGQGPHSH
jgi:hypothetical protein